MEQTSTMEKKNPSRVFALSLKGNQDAKSADFSFKKNGSQYPRKRDTEKVDGNKKPFINRGGRSGQRYVRPREKMDCQVEEKSDSLSEFGSLQRSGGKKQNISHLLNWWGPGPCGRFSNRGSFNKGGFAGRKHVIQHPKYNKEHYLQANCQFVVSFGNDYSSYEKNPDHLVEWDYIQEVRLHTSEPPACPICLFYPVAAKITRCGHIFCFSCILHYLALSDKKWRKCPICFEAITKEDLKSVKPILHKDYGCGEEIELQLMRRDRESLIPIPVSQFSPSVIKQAAGLSNKSPISTHSKLIVATSEEVTKYIVSRELEDLHHQFKEEGVEPEACFIEAAIELVMLRLSLLSSNLFEAKQVKDSQVDSESSCIKSFAQTDCSPSAAYSNPGECAEQFEELKLDDCFSEEDLKLKPTAEKPMDESNITLDPEDLDICHFEAGISQSQKEANGPKSTYYFYQESSGANVFLHALNVHMLVREYGSLENCPHTIKAKLLEKESASMTEELRQRLRYLRHLPVTCSFEVAEIEMKVPLVSQLTIAEFQGQLENRLRKRKKRAKEEHRIEKRVQVEEDKMMGRSRGSSINMTSFKHFPTFAEDPPLSFEDSVVTIQASSPKSDSDGFPKMSPPSFAQVINRTGNRKSASSQSAFPSLGAINDQPLKTKTVDSDLDEDEEVKVPNFRLAFSNAFDKALDEAKRASFAAESNSSQQRGKKGKKKKGIVLLSSGGR